MDDARMIKARVPLLTEEPLSTRHDTCARAHAEATNREFLRFWVDFGDVAVASTENGSLGHLIRQEFLKKNNVEICEPADDNPFRS